MTRKSDQMRLFLSLEDKLAAISDDTKCSRYRRALVAFLESQIGDEHTLMSGEGQIGWTKTEDRDLILATGTRNELTLQMHSRNQTNSTDPIIPRFRKDSESLCPVLVIDSDGVDPDFILDYIADVASRNRSIIHDHIYMGHIERFLRFISPISEGSKPRYGGIFGVIVQNPNLEGGEFSGYLPVMTDNLRHVGSRHTNMAFIERMGTRKRKYGYNSGKINNKNFVNERFLEKGADADLFSIMEDNQAIFIRDPEIWVQHVNSFRGWKTEMSSSCYLSKKDRKQRSTNNRQMRSLWAPSAWDSGRLDFTFRMYDSREQS